MESSDTVSFFKRNYGLEILRAWMCFEVVLHHFWNEERCTSPAGVFFIVFKEAAVPVFMLMSFFFTEKMFVGQNFKKFFQRLFRLLFPHVVWTAVYFLLYSAVDFLFNSRLAGGLSGLLEQLFFGTAFNSTMWFQVHLVILTVLFFLIFRLNGVVAHCIVVAGVLFSFAGQYVLFRGFLVLDGSVHTFLGRLFNMFVMACVGFYASYFELPQRLERFVHKKPAVQIVAYAVLFSAIAVLAVIRRCFEPIVWAGNFLLACEALFLFLLFYLIPFDFMPEKMRGNVMNATRFTMGIYVLHRLVAKVPFILLDRLGFPTRRFWECVLIYLICYGMSFLISRIPGRFPKLLVE